MPACLAYDVSSVYLCLNVAAIFNYLDVFGDGALVLAAPGLIISYFYLLIYFCA